MVFHALAETFTHFIHHLQTRQIEREFKSFTYISCWIHRFHQLFRIFYYFHLRVVLFYSSVIVILVWCCSFSIRQIQFTSDQIILLKRWIAIWKFARRNFVSEYFIIYVYKCIVIGKTKKKVSSKFSLYPLFSRGLHATVRQLKHKLMVINRLLINDHTYLSNLLMCFNLLPPAILEEHFCLFASLYTHVHGIDNIFQDSFGRLEIFKKMFRITPKICIVIA